MHDRRRISNPPPPASAASNAALRAIRRAAITAFGDELRASSAVRAALGSARLSELPRELDALRDFAHAHLAPVMRGVVVPELVAALLDDFEEEIEHACAEGKPSASRISLDTARPTPSDSSEALPEDLAARSVARLVVSRPAVVLVDADRFGRASMARALVSGRCDVRVFDDVATAIEALASTDHSFVIVVEVTGVDVERMLGALVARHPEAPIIAWTRAQGADVAKMFVRAGVKRFEVVAKSARASVVLENVRRFLTSS